MLDSHEVKLIKEIPGLDKIDNSYVNRMFKLTSLAPGLGCISEHVTGHGQRRDL
jgi:hypothetical protein